MMKNNCKTIKTRISTINYSPMIIGSSLLCFCVIPLYCGILKNSELMSVYNRIVMVLGEMSAHALVAHVANSAGRWICQQVSLP
jgi:hypothetical protein